jgi:hypothetical protein
MQFVICRIVGGKLEFVGKEGLTSDPAMALYYDSMEAGNDAKECYFNYNEIFEDQRSEYAVIPAIDPNRTVAEPQCKKFPGPDFFEVHYPRTADEVLDLISNQEFDKLFRATDKIDEAGCWSSSALLDPFSAWAVGHKLCFSFDGSIDETQAHRVIVNITMNPDWTNVLIHRKGNGGAKWFIVELQAKRK